MTNKELAVQIYCSLLQATATVKSNSNSGGMTFPSHDAIAQEIKELSDKLATIDS